MVHDGTVMLTIVTILAMATILLPDLLFLLVLLLLHLVLSIGILTLDHHVAKSR